MRKWISLFVLVALALSVVACGGGGEQQQPAAGSQAPVAKGNAENGKQLFAQSVLAGIASRAGSTVPGESAEQYIRTSIVNTNAHLAVGCNINAPDEPCAANLMPQDWAQKLTPEQIDDLVAYLLTLK